MVISLLVILKGVYLLCDQLTKRVVMKHRILVSLAIFAFLFACSSDNDSSETTTPVTPLELAKVYGGSKNDRAQSITKTTDGGYAVLGYSQSSDGDITDKDNESFDYWVLKFNIDHELQWSKTYGGTEDDRGNAIIQTQDGGFAISGYSSSSDLDVSENAGAQDYWIAKLDTNGNLSWQKSYGYLGADIGNTLLQRDLTASIDYTPIL